MSVADTLEAAFKPAARAVGRLALMLASRRLRKSEILTAHEELKEAAANLSRLAEPNGE